MFSKCGNDLTRCRLSKKQTMQTNSKMKNRTIAVLNTVAIAGAAMAFSIGAQAQCTINMTANQQVMDGFGFSSAWSGQFSSTKNNALYNTLGFSLLRIRIDPNRGWNDERVNAVAAHAAGAKVLGSPWSPPANMKDNNNVVHGSLLPAQYGNYAIHLRDAANTIGLDWVSIQNEPDWNPDYEGCNWTPAQLLTFTRNNAPTIGKPVITAECVGFRDDYSDPILNDGTAVNNISIVAGHFYGNGNYVHQNALNKGKRVWQTEHYLTGGQSDFNVCMDLAKEVNDAMNNRFSAYFWWWVNDSQTDGTCLVNNSGAIIKPGYILGQFAKWIRPGSTRVSATYNPQSNVYVTAYRVNGSTVIVAVNMGGGSVNQQFVIQNGNATTLAGFRTSSSQNMASIGNLTVSGGSFTASLPARSVTTFNQTGTGGGGPVADGTYRISPRHATAQAMDASNAATTNGTQIIQWTYGGGNNQRWTVTNRGNNQYSIIGVQSGKAIEVAGGGTGNGSKVQLWTWLNTAHQKFTFTATSGGYYRITPTHSGASGSCLDVSGNSTANGAVVHLWSYGGGNNQQWAFQAP
jgi:glucuronoarabinoxylan endo-1,4-beta-xylanase